MAIFALLLRPARENRSHTGKVIYHWLLTTKIADPILLTIDYLLLQGSHLKENFIKRYLRKYQDRK